MSLYRLYKQLHSAYGPQSWWPAESAFEVMVGAILTQNTAWTNVEKAITELKRQNALDPEIIRTLEPAKLAGWIRSSGYYNIKAARLQNLCNWLQARGGLDSLQEIPAAVLRGSLLDVKGVGPETADDILLYALDRPVFVIDTYTRRLLERQGFASGKEDYEKLRALFEDSLPGGTGKVALYKEYHALIVLHAKHSCRKQPDCTRCKIRTDCAHATQ